MKITKQNVKKKTFKELIEGDKILIRDKYGENIFYLKSCRLNDTKKHLIFNFKNPLIESSDFIIRVNEEILNSNFIKTKTYYIQIL